MRTSRLIVPALLLCAGFLAGFYLSNELKPAAFGENRVTQVAVVVEDIEKASRLYADLFGMDVPNVVLTDPVDRAHTQYLGKSSTAQARLAFFRLDNLTLELIEPVGGPSTWAESLERNGQSLHHIAFQVDGMDRHIALLTEKGAKLVQRGDFTGGSYAYVDGSDTFGAVFELLTNN